ncbi:UPF0687 protein C20orf27 -like protein [Halotydeus destructor]|nr:UPF0687 protein C20orf27 -like protein [Halotydeus destructor]
MFTLSEMDKIDEASDIKPISKVQFMNEDTFNHESAIQVVDKSNLSYEVHVGFLQMHHHYELCFELDYPQDLGDLYHQCPDVVASQLRVLSVQCEPSSQLDLRHCCVTVEFTANKERLMKEKIVLHSSLSAKELKLTLISRVLGKGKGTPSLRTGIKCIGVDLADESEQSDWQGF